MRDERAVRRRADLALLALCIATFAYLTTEVLPVGLLTVMAGDLHRTPSQIGLLVSGYAAVVVLASLPLTWVTRRVPRRPLFVVTLAGCAAGTLLTALAPDYPVLLAARLLTALTQALFWSVVIPTATSLFPPSQRGRTVTRLAVGTSLAPVLGVPVGTFLGQQFGWRTAFLVLTVLVAGTCVMLAALLPNRADATPTGARGATPDALRYTMLVVVTTLAVTGFLTGYTYIAPFLRDVAGFPASLLAPMLFVSGIAGVVGTVTIGRFLDRHAPGAVIVPVAVVTVALATLYVFGTVWPVVVIGLACGGLAFSALGAGLQNWTLLIAPGLLDLATAGVSTAFNVGIGAGALLGGALISDSGARSVMLAGSALTGLALLVLLGSQVLDRRSLATPAASNR